jgi:hypothetical protein
MRRAADALENAVMMQRVLLAAGHECENGEKHMMMVTKAGMKKVKNRVKQRKKLTKDALDGMIVGGESESGRQSHQLC